MEIKRVHDGVEFEIEFHLTNEEKHKLYDDLRKEFNEDEVRYFVMEYGDRDIAPKSFIETNLLLIAEKFDEYMTEILDNNWWGCMTAAIKYCWGTTQE